MADFMEAEAVESDSDGSEDLARKKRPVGCLSVALVCLLLVALACLFDCTRNTTARIYQNETSSNETLLPGGRQF